MANWQEFHQADLAIPKSDLEEVAFKILEGWRLYRRSIALTSDSGDDVGDDGLELYIDTIEQLPLSQVSQRKDSELSSALRLVMEINAILGVGLEEPEHLMALGMHDDALMRLANIMRARGYHCTIPKEILRRRKGSQKRYG